MGKIAEYKRDAVRRTISEGDGGESANTIRAMGENVDTFTTWDMRNSELQMRREEMRDRSWLTNKTIELQTKSDDLMAAWKKENWEDPTGKTFFLEQSLAELKTQITEQAPSGMAKHNMGQVSDRFILGATRRGQRWEDEQLVDNTKTSVVENVKHLATRAYRDSTPEGLALLLEESVPVIANLTDTVEPELMAKATKDAAEMLTMGMFEGMIEKNRLGTAEKNLESKKYDEDLGVENIKKLKRMLKVKRAHNAAKAKDWEDMKLADPWKFLRKAHNITATPIDFSGKKPGTFLKRTEEINKWNEKYGLDLPYLVQREEIFIHEKLPGETPEVQISFLGQFREVPKAEYKKAMGQIAEKNPSYGSAIALTRTNTIDSNETARQVIRGMRLNHQNKETKGYGVNIPSTKELNAVFDNAFGDSIDNSSVREGVREGAFHHYSISNFDNNKAGKEFNKEDYLKSAYKQVGKPIQVGKHYILPIRSGKAGKFVDEDYMRDLLDEITNEQILKTHKDSPRLDTGEIVDLNSHQGRLNFQQVGEGLVRLQLDTSNLFDKDGNLFVLDFYKLDKAPRSQEGFWDKVKGTANDILHNVDFNSGNKL